MPIPTIVADLMIFELVILICMNGYAYDIFGIISRNSNLPAPIGRWTCVWTYFSRDIGIIRDVMCIVRPNLVSRFPLSSWFPYRFESEDHAIPWFCSKLRFFPIGLSPRTMQYLGSVQNLDFSLSSWFPHRFKSEDHTIPWFCPKLRFPLSSWFPHRFESEDHAIPWFCLKLRYFLK